MGNERRTESLIREQLNHLGYEPMENPHDIVGKYEEQQSELANVHRLLKRASKAGGGGAGYPEFLVHLGSGTIMVVECKASAADHGDPNPEVVHDQPVKMAVDGVLHYAKFLSKELHVVAVAASGVTRNELKTSIFLHQRGQGKPALLLDHSNNRVDDLRSLEEMVELVNFDPSVSAIREEDLKKTAAELHVFLRNYAALSESEKPLIVAGSLIALSNDFFREKDATITEKQYQKYDKMEYSKIGDEWTSAIRRQFEAADIPMDKASMVVQAFSSALSNNPALLQRNFKTKKGGTDGRSVLCAILDKLSGDVSESLSHPTGFDLVGHFYGEFLSYTAGDKKGLGIVLTPPHITELFAKMAAVDKDSVVLDPCAGTGGFLIAAMSEMFHPRNGVALTKGEKDQIKKHGLIGIEKMPSMFALAAANMTLRGDGKSNMYQGSCFESAIIDGVKNGTSRNPRKQRPTVGLMNPPYSMGKIDRSLDEMSFTLNMLDMLARHAVGVVIVPMSCAIGQNDWRKKILDKHTLEAVMTMPPDLFYGVGTQTVTMVFTAGVPHPANKKSWFAQWTDDGFITNRGRKEKRPGDWAKIRNQWLEDFVNRREDTPGYCVSKVVTDKDEWLAAAHMETDYSQLTRESFERVLREFALYQATGGGMTVTEQLDWLLANLPYMRTMSEQVET